MYVGSRWLRTFAPPDSINAAVTAVLPSASASFLPGAPSFILSFTVRGQTLASEWSSQTPDVVTRFEQLMVTVISRSDPGLGSLVGVVSPHSATNMAISGDLKDHLASFGAEDLKPRPGTELLHPKEATLLGARFAGEQPGDIAYEVYGLPDLVQSQVPFLNNLNFSLEMVTIRYEQTVLNITNQGDVLLHDVMPSEVPPIISGLASFLWGEGL
jgi:hypothetical protein